MNDAGKMVPIDMKNESIYLKNENCDAILEFAPNRMIIFAKPVHLFLVTDFQVTQKIDDHNLSNENKFAFTVFPGYD